MDLNQFEEKVFFNKMEHADALSFVILKGQMFDGILRICSFMEKSEDKLYIFYIRIQYI